LVIYPTEFGSNPTLDAANVTVQHSGYQRFQKSSELPTRRKPLMVLHSSRAEQVLTLVLVGFLATSRAVLIIMAQLVKVSIGTGWCFD
jgi:hypothetical protein